MRVLLSFRQRPVRGIGHTECGGARRRVRVFSFAVLFLQALAMMNGNVAAKA